MKFIFSSGLGNQLFMYACYLSVYKRITPPHTSSNHDSRDQLKLKVQPLLFPYTYANVHNGFELDKIFRDERFDSAIESLKRSKLTNIGKEPFVQKMIRILTNKLLRYKTVSDSEVYSIDSLEQILKNNRKIQFAGWFQVPDFIEDSYCELIEHQIVYNSLDDRNDAVISTMNECNSVSLHIRRGDYVGNPYFDVLDVGQYVTDAINKMQNLIGDARYFIFSDDVNWCKSNLHLPNNSVFVDWNRGENSFKDLILMSKCHHNIIANSSFSYWGAILNKHRDKIVIAPKVWSATLTSEKIAPKTWLLL